MALRSLHETGTLPIEPLPGCVAQAEISRWAFGTSGLFWESLAACARWFRRSRESFAMKSS